MAYRRMIRALVLGSVWMVSCKYSEPSPAVGEPKEKSLGSEQQREPEPANQKGDTPEEAKRTPTEATGTCDDRSCVASNDCCSGYQCGFDPERSKVQRYCLPQ